MSSQQENRRSDLHAIDDLQVRETRQRLVEAFREASTEELSSVSVTWLCKKSGVARSTFYTHFATVEDLAVFTISEAFASASQADVDRRSTHEQDRRTITRVGLEGAVSAFDASRSDILYAIRIGSRPAVVQRLTEEFARLTRRTVAAESNEADDDAVDLVTEFISAGTVHVLFLWMERGQPDCDVLIDQLLDLLPHQLTRD